MQTVGLHQQKPGEKGMAYITRCRELRDKLFQCGGSISEDAFVTVIIGGLGPQWRATKAILRAHGRISEAALCAEIHAEQQDMDLQEEQHKKETSAPEFAFHTQQRYNNNNNRRKNKGVSNNSDNINRSRDNIGSSRDNIGSSRDNIGSSRDNIGSSRTINSNSRNVNTNCWSFNDTAPHRRHTTDTRATTTPSTTRSSS
ncbi:unnamed protein product [Closterium sp. NIES-54]